MRPTTRGCTLAFAMIWFASTSPASHAGILIGAAAPCPEFPGSDDTVVACFDDLPSGSAASAGALGDLSVLDALVLSEADTAFLLGVDTAGWATSGDQGLLNSLQPVVDFLFDATITLFRLSVVALPGPSGDPVPVVVQGFSGETRVATVLSDVSRGDDDGFHDDWLQIQDDTLGFDRVRVFAALGPCSGDDCEVGTTSSFFADTVKYVRGEPRGLPESGVAAFAMATLAGFVAWRTSARSRGEGPVRSRGEGGRR